MVGEMELVSDEPQAASAEALDYTEVLVLDQTLLRTLLLRSPRPVQIITGYLVNRIKTLTKNIAEPPSGLQFLSVCRVVALCWRAAAASGQPDLSYAELSSTLKDILLITQLEIDAIFDKLSLLRLVRLTTVKGAHTRRDPLLGEAKPGPSFVKDRRVRLTDGDEFLEVAKSVAREFREREDFSVDLEFFDLADFAREAGTTPDILAQKIAYREIPEDMRAFGR